jgi:membrane protein required for colicin V production
MLDIIGIIILALSFFRGFRKGAVVALCSLLGIVLGMLAALKLSGALGAYLMEKGWVTSAWAQIIAYVLLFIGVVMLVRLLAKAIETALKAAMLGLINRLVGGLLYAFIGALVWSSLLWIANRAHLLAPETIVASHTYGYFAPVAPWTFGHIGAVLPFARDTFSDLEHFFDEANKQLPEHVGADR